MVALEHLQQRLEDTNALIVQVENALSLPENKAYSGSLAANLKSLQNMRERLETVVGQVGFPQGSDYD